MFYQRFMLPEGPERSGLSGLRSIPAHEDPPFPPSRPTKYDKFALHICKGLQIWAKPTKTKLGPFIYGQI